MTTDRSVPHTPPSLFIGLDGSNPLAFLAALGVLRTLDKAWPERDVRLIWAEHNGAWCPKLHAKPALKSDEIVDTLFNSLCAKGQSPMPNPHLDLGKNLSVPPEKLREHALKAFEQASPTDRRWADYVASFGCEILTTEKKMNNKKVIVIDHTALCFLGGSGRQYYLDRMRTLAQDARREHLFHALFEMWNYRDERCGMRWDPTEAREYAYQWGDPSKEPTRSVWGANLLAAEGTTLYPTVPTTRGLPTAGFAKHNRQKVFFTWPLWDVPLTLDTVRSLICHPGLREQEPDRALFRAMGVPVIWRCEKVRIGQGANYKLNFRPAWAI